MSSTTGVLWLNERDVYADFGLVLQDPSFGGFPGNLMGAPRDVPQTESPELSGGIIDPKLSRRRKLNPPQVKGALTATSLAAAMANLDALKALLGEGQIMLRTGYAPDRYVLAMGEAFDGLPGVPIVMGGFISVVILFNVAAGVAFKTTPDGYALSASRTACPIGTSACTPVFLVHGGGGTLTNPVITYRTAGGDPVVSMNFTVSLGATEALRIDCARATVSRVTAGVVTDGISLWTGGDFPILRPFDAWGEGGLYPTVEISASAGTPFGEITYTRAYL
jgi:hypothetical protein